MFAVLVVCVLIGLLTLKMCRHEPAGVEDEKLVTRPPPYSPFREMIYPNDHDLLANTGRTDVFQPTGSDRPESAFYGSTRTAASRRGPVPSFHEGIDIAPVRRDARSRPLDAVKAIADGKVAYIASAPGGSSYGCYVVLIHDDPLGPVYSLYAHLAKVDKNLEVDDEVSAGAPLGIMGNTASYNIPVWRAHLHLEIGLMTNSRFGEWSKARGVRPNRGNWHGWNLQGLDPLGVYTIQRGQEHFVFADYLAVVPPAFEMVVNADKLPDYFKIYPSLWKSGQFQKGGIVLALSEGGVVLSGRNANPEEQAFLLDKGGVFVQNVNEDVLGRNGRRIIVKRGNSWETGSRSKQWLDIFLY